MVLSSEILNPLIIRQQLHLSQDRAGKTHLKLSEDDKLV